MPRKKYQRQTKMNATTRTVVTTTKTGDKVQRDMLVLDSGKVAYIDSKDTKLQRFARNDDRQRREIAVALKNARDLALLPYSKLIMPNRRRDRPESDDHEGVLIEGDDGFYVWFVDTYEADKLVGRELPALGDSRLAVALAFASGLAGLEELTGDGSELSEELLSQAKQAGERFVAAQRWSSLTGERVDTATLRERLGISRQALHQRVTAGTLLAVPGNGTNWYPTWQFRAVEGTDRLEARAVVTQLLQAFRDHLEDDATAHTIVGWAATPQPELDGIAPRDWIAGDGDDGPVLAAANRAAAALAR